MLFAFRYLLAVLATVMVFTLVFFGPRGRRGCRPGLPRQLFFRHRTQHSARHGHARAGFCFHRYRHNQARLCRGKRQRPGQWRAAQFQDRCAERDAGSHCRVWS